MRLTSDMYVSALLRRVSATGGFGAVIRRGNREAGAIFILERSRTGETVLYAPAPQMVYTETKPDERFFTPVLTSPDGRDVSDKLEKEARFDPDIWAVEIEPGSIPLGEMIEISG